MNSESSNMPAGIIFSEGIPALKQLAQEPRLLSTALEAAANGIVIANRAGTIEWVNDAFTRLTGYSAAEAIGQNPRVLKSGKHPAEFYTGLWSTITAGQVWHSEVVNKRKDGVLYDEEMTITPVRNNSGEITNFIAIKQDVSGRKHAERALEITLQRVNMVLSHMYSGVLLVSSEGRVEFANQAFCDGFGLAEAPAELVGSTPTEMLDRIKGAYQQPGEALIRIQTLVERGEPLRGEEVAMSGGRTFLRDFVPLNVHGSLYGRLWLHTDITERKQAEEKVRLAEAKLQGERDQLEARVQQRTADLSALNNVLQAEILKRQGAEEAHQLVQRHLAEAQETERGRISRELHDRLGQDLTALKLGLQNLRRQNSFSKSNSEHIQKLERTAEGLIRDLHRVAWELRPSVLDDLGLGLALQRYTDDWSQNTGVTVDLLISVDSANQRLPREFETVLYRIAQEALTNVARHTQAHRVSVLLERRPGYVSLIVEDDGQGFEAQQILKAPASPHKLGLLGMQERAKLAGGTLTIESTPDVGTVVIVRLPITPGAEGRG